MIRTKNLGTRSCKTQGTCSLLTLLLMFSLGVWLVVDCQWGQAGSYDQSGHGGQMGNNTFRPNPDNPSTSSCIGGYSLKSDKVPDQSWIFIRFQSNAESPEASIHDFNGTIVISGPDGKHTGESAFTGDVFREISHSFYGTDAIQDPNMEGEGAGDAQRSIEIRWPAPGRYELRVEGTRAGKYDLYLIQLDKQSEQLRRSFESVPILPGVVHTFALEIAESLGSISSFKGGFDGEGDGEESPQVNRLLSYASVVQGRISLRPQTKRFSLFIVYAEEIKPGSFYASLNGVDVSGLFSPVPGGWEIVSIPTKAGDNILTLSIMGDLPDSTVNLKDTDRLLFSVENNASHEKVP